MSTEVILGKEQIDTYLKEVAKQYRKLSGKSMPAEITLIGGASILVNYGFRDSTYDIDALIHAASSMKDAINYVTDTMKLPNDWLNDDFKNTTSYTPKLVNYSVYYRTFSNVVTIRTITGEYLVAMKLKAFRKYKHDISDIVGIMREHERMGKPLTFEQIDTAVKNLYDGWENMPENACALIQSILSESDMDELYETYVQEESAAKDVLISFDEKYPKVVQNGNLDAILSQLLQRQDKERPDSST